MSVDKKKPYRRMCPFATLPPFFRAATIILQNSKTCFVYKSKANIISPKLRRADLKRSVRRQTFSMRGTVRSLHLAEGHIVLKPLVMMPKVPSEPKNNCFKS